MLSKTVLLNNDLGKRTSKTVVLPILELLSYIWILLQMHPNEKNLLNSVPKTTLLVPTTHSVEILSTEKYTNYLLITR